MKAALFAICAMAIGPLLIWLEDDLASDFRLQSHKLVIAGIPTTDRKCKSTVFIFNQCGFKYELNGKSHSKDYTFFSFGAPETVHLLRSTETGELTSTVGQAYFSNRIVTLAVVNLMSLIAACLLFSAVFNKRRPSLARVEPDLNVPTVAHGQDAMAPAPEEQAATFGERSPTTFGRR
ncbi:MAG: hypothetical protein AAGF81_07050 [Pseudomonadota bacterium]